MKIKRLLFTILSVCSIVILGTGCGARNEKSTEVTISKYLNIAIYAATETGGDFIPVGPELLQESVAVDKLLHYDEDGDLITVPFRFKNHVKYTKITAENVGRHIVITADGEVVSTPMVKMRIDNGACSFLLSKSQAQKFFPKDIIEKVLSESK